MSYQESDRDFQDRGRRGWTRRRRWIEGFSKAGKKESGSAWNKGWNKAARKVGKIETARALKAAGSCHDLIVKVTGFSWSEVKALPCQ
jgi:hypothetical protein